MRLKIILAFLIVYLVWGSTYLAIRVGVADLPPALFAGVRFVFSGLLLWSYARLRGIALPRAFVEWKTIVIVGILLLVGANGLVVWGEQWVPSNQAALIIATSALWIAGFGAMGAQGQALGRQTLIGLAVGFAGVIGLFSPHLDTNVPGYFWGQMAIVLSPILWAAGSIYSKRRAGRESPLMAAAMQMLTAGFILSGIGLMTGETSEWTWTMNGMAALAYLIVLGTVAFAAYVWLLHTVTPAELGTYAYVNPVIAVVLGWWILGESLDSLQIIGMLVTVFGVILVSTAKPVAPVVHDLAPRP